MSHTHTIKPDHDIAISSHYYFCTLLPVSFITLASTYFLLFFFTSLLCWTVVSLVAQTVKRLSTMRETPVRSLGREDLLEKEMAIHSSTVAWKILWTEEPGRLQPLGSQTVEHGWATSLYFYFINSAWFMLMCERIHLLDHFPFTQCLSSTL